MPNGFDDGKYVDETIKFWDKRPDDVNFEIERIQYAIKRDLKREKDQEYAEALELLHDNIADKKFWLQMDAFMNIELPKS